MVFGGQAVLLHGEFRVTRDIDITLGIEPAEAAPILAMIAQLGLQTDHLQGGWAGRKRTFFQTAIASPECL